MTVEKAMELVPQWTERETPHREETPESMIRIWITKKLEWFARRYGILVIAAAGFVVYTVLLSAGVEARTETRVRQEMAVEYASQLERYKQELREQEQAQYFKSGEASREAFVNQEIDAATQLIQEEPNETMRGTKLGVAIARLMSGNYGSTLREVVEQPDQWMNYHSDTKITQEVRAFAEKIVRDYYENGVVPDGLTKDIQWLTWTPGDYLARNNWNASAATVTWRWHG